MQLSLSITEQQEIGLIFWLLKVIYRHHGVNSWELSVCQISTFCVRVERVLLRVDTTQGHTLTSHLTKGTLEVSPTRPKDLGQTQRLTTAQWQHESMRFKFNDLTRVRSYTRRNPPAQGVDRHLCKYN